MEAVFTLKNLLFVGVLIVSVNSPAAFAATQKNRIITDARDDKTTIEFTLDEVDCKTNLAKTVVISRDI